MAKAKATRNKKGRYKCSLKTIGISYTDPVLPEELTRKGRTTNKKYIKAKLLAKDMVEFKNLATEIATSHECSCVCKHTRSIKNKMYKLLTTFGISIAVVKASIEMYEDMEKCPLGTITRMIGEEYPTVRQTLIKLSRCIKQIKNC